MINENDIELSDGLTTAVAISLKDVNEFKSRFKKKKVYDFYIHSKVVNGNKLILNVYNSNIFNFLGMLEDFKIDWFVPSNKRRR